MIWLNCIRVTTGNIRLKRWYAIDYGMSVSFCLQRRKRREFVMSKKLVFWKNDKIVSERENIATLGAITSLKHMELKEENFQSVPSSIMITDILTSSQMKPAKPSDYNPEYKHMEEEDRPYDKVKVTAVDYNGLLEINEQFKSNAELAKAMVQNFRKFNFVVKFSLKGVENFMEIIDKARENAKKKKIGNPALVLKDCEFAFIPQWDMGKENHSGVEIILKSVGGLEVIEEVAVNSDSTETEQAVDVSDMFD